ERDSVSHARDRTRETPMKTDRGWRAGVLRAIAVPAVALAMVQSAAAEGGQDRQGARRSRPQAIRVTVDLLPDDPDNVVDPVHPGKLPVAILGTPGFDPKSVDAGSL